MYQFCLKLKKNPTLPRRCVASHWCPEVLGKKIKFKKIGGGIISSWSKQYTPLKYSIAICALTAALGGGGVKSLGDVFFASICLYMKMRLDFIMQGV